MTSPEDTKRKRPDNFYQLVGICIKRWAGIEDKLFAICHLALKSDHQQAAIVYYRTPALDARLSLTDELVRSVLPKKVRKDGGHDHPLVAEWKVLVSEIRDLLPVRNMIAHAPVRHVTHIEMSADKETKAARADQVASWLELAVSPNEDLRGRDEKVPIKDTDLPSHIKAVDAIYDRLTRFLKEMHGIPR